MFNFFRRKPRTLTRMSHPIWKFHFEELSRDGKPTDDYSVMNRIVWSCAAYYDKKAEAMSREGYMRYGRGAIVHKPLVVSGSGFPHKEHPSSQLYVTRTQVVDSWMYDLGKDISEALIRDMDSYDPDKEFISAVMMTFDNEKPTPLDFFVWITIPY
jgi:hypothetical protein